MTRLEIEKRAEEILAPFISRAAMPSDTHQVTLNDGRVANIPDSHFGVQAGSSTYSMIARCSSDEEAIEKVVRSAYFELMHNTELYNEVVARIYKERQPKEYTGPVQHFTK